MCIRDSLALDDLSGGRLTLGLGAGGVGWDATVLGHEPWSRGERTARFEEFVALLDRLLRSDVTTAHGRYYSADDAPMQPGCVQQPRLPFAVAASGTRSMALAAEHAQVWVTNGAAGFDGDPLTPSLGVPVVRQQGARFDDAMAAAGRDPSSVDRLLLTGLQLASGLESVEAFLDTIGRYGELGFTDLVVHWPRPNEPYVCDPTVFEAAITAAVASG